MTFLPNRAFFPNLAYICGMGACRHGQRGGTLALHSKCCKLYFCISSYSTSSSAIAERPCSRLDELWPKAEDWKWETIFYGHYRANFNQCDVIGQQSNWIRWKKCKIRAVMPLKVGINRKPICDFLLVI